MIELHVGRIPLFNLSHFDPIQLAKKIKTILHPLGQKKVNIQSIHDELDNDKMYIEFKKSYLHKKNDSKDKQISLFQLERNDCQSEEERKKIDLHKTTISLSRLTDVYFVVSNPNS